MISDSSYRYFTDPAVYLALPSYTAPTSDKSGALRMVADMYLYSMLAVYSGNQTKTSLYNVLSSAAFLTTTPWVVKLHAAFLACGYTGGANFGTNTATSSNSLRASVRFEASMAFYYWCPDDVASVAATTSLTQEELQTTLDRYLWDSVENKPKDIWPADINILEIHRDGDIH